MGTIEAKCTLPPQCKPLAYTLQSEVSLPSPGTGNILKSEHPSTVTLLDLSGAPNILAPDDVHAADNSSSTSMELGVGFMRAWLSISPSEPFPFSRSYEMLTAA